jgi:uracil-DNA glycosylase
MILEKYIPADWRVILENSIKKPSFSQLNTYLENEFKEYTIFPPKAEIFSALKLTPYNKVKVLILGQDPYHDDNQAHGLAFSVRKGIKLPPSLKNIYKELQSDIGCPISSHGYLEEWARQGILMINTVLTVRAHQANSHAKKGWEEFTDAIIQSLNEHSNKIVFVLWGNNAAKKIKLINTEHHYIIKSAHPSPLSAHRGFFGSKPFSKINNFLKSNGKSEINWCIENQESDFSDLPLFATNE